MEKERLAAAERQRQRQLNQDHIRRQMADNDRKTAQARQEQLLENRLLKQTEEEYSRKLDELRRAPIQNKQHFRRSAKWYS